MKNLSKILLFGIIIVGVGNSCSTTSPVTPQTQAQLLIGSWKAVSYVRTLCTDPLKNETLKACATECETLVITSSTVTIKKTGSADQVINYTISGNVLIASPPQGDSVITFLIAGTTLTIVSTEPNSGSSANCVGTNVYTRI